MADGKMLVLAGVDGQKDFARVITTLRVTALMCLMAIVSLVVLVSGGSITFTTAALLALSISPFVFHTQFWKSEPDIWVLVFVGVVIGYIARVPLLDLSPGDRFGQTIRTVDSSEALRFQDQVSLRVLTAVGCVVAVLLLRAAGRRATLGGASAVARPFTATSLRSGPKVILIGSLVWLVLGLAASNRFAAVAAPLSIARAIVPGTVLLTAAIVLRFSPLATTTPEDRRKLEVAILVIVMVGILQGRQSVLVLPFMIWLPLAIRNSSDAASGVRRIVKTSLAGLLVVIIGGLAVGQVEAQLKGQTASQITASELLFKLSDRTAVFDRELSIYALQGGEPVSDSISPGRVASTTVERLVPGLAFGENQSMGKLFAVDVQGKEDDRRQEGAWGWVASAVEILGSTWWPLVIVGHLLLFGVLLDGVGRTVGGEVLQIALGQMLILQWIPSGNLDRLWSTAVREIVLGLVLFHFLDARVETGENDEAVDSESLVPA